MGHRGVRRAGQPGLRGREAPVIRECLWSCSERRGARIPLLYGGSVNPENAPELIPLPNIDGLFIGRSAWEAEKFDRIIRSCLALLE